jgi:hypothetical protein
VNDSRSPRPRIPAPPVSPARPPAAHVAQLQPERTLKSSLPALHVRQAVARPQLVSPAPSSPLRVLQQTPAQPTDPSGRVIQLGKKKKSTKASGSGIGIASTLYQWKDSKWKQKGKTAYGNDYGHTEQVVYTTNTAEKQRIGWFGLNQNAAPCSECTNVFTKQSKKGASFVFRVTGDVGGYASGHDQTVPFTMYVHKGQVTYNNQVPEGAPNTFPE